MSQDQSFTTVVLAGSRSAHDPVAEAAGVSCKALAPIGATRMIFRVLDALQATPCISHSILCGPRWSIIEQEPQLLARIQSKKLGWIPPQTTPSTSAAFAMESMPYDRPILITTADHALLTPEIVEEFCAKAANSQSDVVVGLVPYALVKEAFPHSKRTVMKFKDQGYCGCNLFAFLTPQGRTITHFWQRVEQERKNPIRLIKRLGWRAVLRYMAGRLSLTQALAGISQKLSLDIKAVCLPFPQAAVDVDTVADWELVQDILRKSPS